ncbi:MAG: DoxX family protein [Proteobacteria bacterium]|nr:DoxX family protein [Pseudomonadota bacterium]MDA1301649.1 DoxX family protein [Pseudomonadota bacterium]
MSTLTEKSTLTGATADQRQVATAFIRKTVPWTELAGRVLIALIFISAGYSKIGGYEGTAGYMAAMGVPASLLPLVIVTELIGGLFILAGLFTRASALALAGFTFLSAVLFHGNVADPAEQVQFMKNLAITGGFLFLVVNGAGKISLDRRLGWN